MKHYKQKASGNIEEVYEGFNGWAFLFGPIWFLVKGMVGMMFWVLIGNLLISSLFGLIGGLIFWIIIGGTANSSYEQYLIKRGYSILKPKKKKREKKWDCDYCKKDFYTKVECEKHEKTCRKKK
jgi:hypothetical protein